MFNLTQNESWKISSLPSSPNITRVTKSRRMRRAGHLTSTGENRGLYRVLMGKPEGKRPLVRPMCRWEDNIKINPQEIGLGGGAWTELIRLGIGIEMSGFHKMQESS